jgi:hypothetical protein
MLLPNANQVVIADEKVRDYLLSVSHPVGRFKATFFQGLGYSPNNWAALRDDLAAIARSAEATAGQPSPFGQKYETRAKLAGPSGRSATVVVVWIVIQGEAFPRFVTAFPS